MRGWILPRTNTEREEFLQGMEELFDVLLDKAKAGKISYDDIEDHYFGPLMRGERNA